MSASLSLSNDSFSNSSINSFHAFYVECFNIEAFTLLFYIFTASQTLVLIPFCVSILYRGLHLWWHHRSSSTSLSDTFTYHLLFMELADACGNIFCSYFLSMNNFDMLDPWMYLFSFVWYGETLFYLVTCLEPYVAVVHPIYYLSLKNERLIRTQNVTTGCIWLLCFGLTALLVLNCCAFIWDSCLLIFSVITISYFCLSVLCVLIRPGPGEQGWESGSVDQSKKRAFYTIAAILGALLLRTTWNLIWSVQPLVKGHVSQCAWLMCSFWTKIPSSLILPLLYVHRAGMLTCCKKDIG